ncbi:amidase family protein [Penicillium brasilianum]|uniref:Amidase family protein n=1 Tax=Penicillium brasilianum TaxID=104259 RepID=A0A1S9RLU0_PENBI|nr:amidase family protein [Penicillium brasilianum]
MSVLDNPKSIEWLNLVDASIKQLLHALNTRAITSVQLVSLYLHRIGHYDCRGPSLNSVCVLNPNVFEEAQESDDYRASGRPLRPLEGVPFTVKDSFMVKGMTVAAASPAFADLIASKDVSIVALLRDAGAVILGKTNMPAMADGGGQRGLYGRAESPYNLEYSTTAYASGSSNGCGTSTTASFASFGFAGETVSSGRSPASNNGLVGYSPSRGITPNRFQWPLYPTCDVIVPHTRSMEDLFAILNVIVADDPYAARGVDFWRNQPYISIPKASELRPVDYQSLANTGALRGKRIAVPRCFIGAPSAKPSHVCIEPVRKLWDRARYTLESVGAVVIETDFPLLEKYVKQDFPGQSCNVPGISEEWTKTERCQMIATAWDDFLRINGDPKCPNLLCCDPDKIHPRIAPMDDPSKHSEAQNQVRYSDMIESVRGRTHTLYNLPGVEPALQALEDMRKREFESWMDSSGFDIMAFPTNGDVPYANSDESPESMLHALQDGIKYANGGRALKHVGLPCITLPMGTMEEKQMPVGITFVSKAYADNDLLQYAYAYEAASKARTLPTLTPPIASDFISMIPSYVGNAFTAKPILTIRSAIWEKMEATELEIRRQVSVKGIVQSSRPEIGVACLEVFVDGKRSEVISVPGDEWEWEACLSRPNVEERYPTIGRVPKNCFLIVIIASLKNGRTAGSLIMLD